MKRLYTLLPGIVAAKKIIAEIRNAEVDDRNIHAIARADLRLDKLSEGRLAQRPDLLPVLVQGVMNGGTFGALAGIVALSMPEIGLVLAGGAMQGLMLARNDVGKFIEYVLGGGRADARFDSIHEHIMDGEILLMIDFPNGYVDEIMQLVVSRCPQTLVSEGPSWAARLH